jgi:hypothetical protein
MGLFDETSGCKPGKISGVQSQLLEVYVVVHLAVLCAVDPRRRFATECGPWWAGGVQSLPQYAILRVPRDRMRSIRVQVSYSEINR